MGKRLDITYHEGNVTFLTPEAVYYRSDPYNDDIDFSILRGIINPFEESEEDTGEIAGYDVKDIFSIQESQIPDIETKYDAPELGLKDMTIKEIVMAMQKDLSKEYRKTA